MLMSAVLLAGCYAAGADIQTELDMRLDRILAMKPHKPFYNHTYYSYYCEPYIGRIGVEETSNIFSLDGNKFVMNLKVDDIINRRYYSDSSQTAFTELKGGTRVAFRHGIYTDYDGNEHQFDAAVYYLDGVYFTVMETDSMEFFSSGNYLQSVQAAAEMMKIAGTVRIAENDIITAFSSRQTIVNNRKKLELFQNIAPESGMIQELFENEEYLKSNGEIFGDNYNVTMNTPEPEPEETMDGTIIGDEFFEGEYSELAEGEETAGDADETAGTEDSQKNS